MKARHALLFLLIIFQSLSAQITQTVKGKVTDKVTGMGLPGAVVQVKSVSGLVVTADNNGFYRIMNVPVGRQSFIFSYTGYKAAPVNDVVISSGKEVVLNIDLEESAVEMDEVVVTSKDTDVVSNMQMANMKTFSIEETERYAGSRQDPARMAQNFAGIQGTNDSRNDIVIRGNSPAGLLWRMEDIDIPNPNHFAVAGSAGGPQSIINNKYLANSEFYTGAFPATYGNALGGVFDLKLRNGNHEKHERTFQFGILGTELALEGPLSRKSGASYLLTYRYSTLAIFGTLNFKFGTDAIPNYQDMGLRLNFPTKKAGVFSFSSIGGLSGIKIVLSSTAERPQELYGDQNRDQYFNSNMGVGILNHVIALNSKTVMKTSLAYGVQTLDVEHFQVLRNKDFVPNDTLPKILGYNFYEGKSTLAWFVRSKLNARNSLKAGFFVNRIDVNFHDSIKINSLYDTVARAIEQKPYKTRINNRESFFLIQPYISYVHKFNDRLSLNCGVFSQFLSLSNRYSVEPRAGLRYQLRGNQVLSFSYGLHSQMQPTYIYFSVPDTIVQNGQLVANTQRVASNRDLDFSKSHHFVAGHDLFAGRLFKIRTELYYQYLFHVPVYVVPSSVSLLNRGATFNRFFPIYTMDNRGTGTNYGVELTIERRFSDHYYFMINGSLFESKYTGSNGREANTDFNGNYMTNFLGGLEYPMGLNKKDALNLGVKFTYGGGRRYSPVNIAASNAVMDVVAIDEQVNTLQFPAYQRLDFRVSYKINGKKIGTEIALDLVNVLNTRNVLALSYTPDPANLSADPLSRNYQLGFLPLFYVKIDF